MVVTLAHARELQYCSKGIRQFCERHGIDFYRFRHGGIPVEELQGIDDAMLHKLIELALQDDK